MQDASPHFQNSPSLELIQGEASPRQHGHAPAPISAYQRRRQQRSSALSGHTPPPANELLSSIPTNRLREYSESFLVSYCRVQKQRSARTVELRRMMVGRLLWFLDDRKYKECGTPELEDFFAHLTFGHEEPGGRWNMGGEHLSFRAMQPVTILGYYRHLAVLFEYLVMKGHLDVSPFRTIGVPEAHSDQIIPFTDHEVQAMLDAAKRRGMHKNAPKYNSPVLIARNQAIILFLVSSGVRASELCGLKLGDIDLTGRRAVVTGKGNKRRVVPFSDNAETALRRYLNARYPNPQERQPGDALFASEGTCSTSDFMNRQSLRQLISKIGKAAGLSIPKCSTHTFRHTFALRCAENGWDVLRLKEVMGHTNIKTTMIYINLAQSTAPLLEGAYLPGNDLRI